MDDPVRLHQPPSTLHHRPVIRGVAAHFWSDALAQRLRREHQAQGAVPGLVVGAHGERVRATLDSAPVGPAPDQWWSPVADAGPDDR